MNIGNRVIVTNDRSYLYGHTGYVQGMYERGEDIVCIVDMIDTEIGKILRFYIDELKVIE